MQVFREFWDIDFENIDVLTPVGKRVGFDVDKLDTVANFHCSLSYDKLHCPVMLQKKQC